jgi:hypothetical protein
MRGNLMLGLLLFIAPCASADSVDVLTGTNHAHGYTYDYSFTVNTTLFSFTDAVTGALDTAVAATLNGTFLTYNKHVGCNPCTTTFINDAWEYFPWETMVMWEWGPVINKQTGQQKWELITAASGAYIVDPPEPSALVATPESSSLVLLGCGLALVLRRAKLAAKG